MLCTRTHSSMDMILFRFFLFAVYNTLSERESLKRERALRDLLPNAGTGVTVQAPFYCDYGYKYLKKHNQLLQLTCIYTFFVCDSYNIHVGDDVFMNFNCVILDVAPVHIGSRTMFGPSVQVYTATHPLNAKVSVFSSSTTF